MIEWGNNEFKKRGHRKGNVKKTTVMCKLSNGIMFQSLVILKSRIFSRLKYKTTQLFMLLLFMSSFSMLPYLMFPATHEFSLRQNVIFTTIQVAIPIILSILIKKKITLQEKNVLRLKIWCRRFWWNSHNSFANIMKIMFFFLKYTSRRDLWWMLAALLSTLGRRQQPKQGLGK